MKTTDSPIVVEYNFTTSVEKLWNAITIHEEMAQWFFENIVSFNPEVGFETQFPVQSENRTFTHLWKIIEVVPFKRITYNWKYEEYPGDSFVTFELIEKEDLVKLKLSMKIIDDFPEEIPEFTRESCIEGWNYFIAGNLNNYLNK